MNDMLSAPNLTEASRVQHQETPAKPSMPSIKLIRFVMATSQNTVASQQHQSQTNDLIYERNFKVLDAISRPRRQSKHLPGQFAFCPQRTKIVRLPRPNMARDNVTIFQHADPSAEDCPNTALESMSFFSCSGVRREMNIFSQELPQCTISGLLGLGVSASLVALF